MSDRSKPVFVIIGLGFSAVLNHLLLRTTQEGKERVGDLCIVHIGLPDPWADYDIEKMGQWPTLLSLPGFSSPHADQCSTDFLRCSAFAEGTNRELEKLEKAFNDTHIAGMVLEVTEAGENFEVRYESPEGIADVIIARKIDVCTGLGPAKRLERWQIDKSLRKEYLDGHPPSGQYQRLMTGEEFLCRNTIIPENARICVCGNSVAAWCVERALKANVESVLWVSRGFTEQTFLPSLRNDSLVNYLARKQDGNLEFQNKLIPRDRRLWLASKYEVRSITSAEHLAELSVQFSEYNGGDQAHCCRFHTDSNGKDRGGLGVSKFDQVVLAIGQKNVRDFPYFSPASLEGQWFPIARFSDPAGSSSGSNFRVGVSDQFNDRIAKIRILGSAARYLEDLDTFGTVNIQSFEDLLPRQGLHSQIPSAAISIAWANGMFGIGHPNQNLNTAEEHELVLIGMSDNEANAFVSVRSSRVEPLTEIPPALRKFGARFTY